MKGVNMPDRPAIDPDDDWNILPYNKGRLESPRFGLSEPDDWEVIPFNNPVPMSSAGTGTVWPKGPVKKAEKQSAHDTGWYANESTYDDTAGWSNGDRAIREEAGGEGEDYHDGKPINAWLGIGGWESTYESEFLEGLEGEDEKTYTTVNEWLNLYAAPTVSKTGRTVEIPSDAITYKWAMFEGLTDINPWARIILENEDVPVTVNIGEQGELTNEEGRYWVAVGPKVVNPNQKEDKRITAESMNYGVILDVVIQDDSGNISYIPCVVGDIKAHTFPNGIYQTGYGYRGRKIIQRIMMVQ